MKRIYIHLCGYIEVLPWLGLSFALLFAFLHAAPARAQASNVPGKYDFYLLNLSWSPEFCSTHAANPQCAAKPGFIVHGLWPQNFDGSFPTACGSRPGPEHPERNLDISPDLHLLQHEWVTHGTCTTLAPDDFFGLERKAFHSVAVPKFLDDLDREVMMKPAEVLDMFAKANPSFPASSLVLSCGNNRLTAIEICLTKDGLAPIACQNVHECHAQVIRIAPRNPK